MPGTYQLLVSSSARAMSCRSETTVTMKTAVVDIPARTAVTRRGTSEAASV